MFLHTETKKEEEDAEKIEQKPVNDEKEKKWKKYDDEARKSRVVANGKKVQEENGEQEITRHYRNEKKVGIFFSFVNTVIFYNFLCSFRLLCWWWYI